MDEEDMPLAGFVGIVLAGGRAQRMGRNKLLMEVAGRPMIRHVVETVRGVAARVVVVTGHQSERVREALARLPDDFVEAGPEEGAAAAIAHAVGQVEAADGVIVCVGDQPRLTTREITGLIERFLAGDRARALVPVRLGRRGYPVVLPPRFDLRGIDLAADDLHTAHPDRVTVFSTRNPVYESSVDTPEDYRALFSI